MDLSVILTTYNQPEALEKVLWGYAAQTDPTFEIVIADDGSGPATGALIERMQGEARLELRHVWHEDRGFRKTEILNRAIVVASGEYLVFSDGDCVPRDDFVERHRALARPRRFLSGGYLKLGEELSAAVTADDIRSQKAFDQAWLRRRGWRPGRRALRLCRSELLAHALDVLSPTSPTWNGHNASAWKEAILEVNGFDLDMGYGGLDRALGERLENLGVRGLQIRHRAPCLHLYHPRPYRSPDTLRQNREIRNRIRRNRETRARSGIAELPEWNEPGERLHE